MTLLIEELFPGNRHLPGFVDQISAEIGYAPMGIDPVYVIGALLAGIALKDPVG
jgi:hypothetical protein